MIIKSDAQVTEFRVTDSSANNVAGQILIGPEDGSNNIVMRRFKVLSGGFTPHHVHDFEHVVKVMRGRGIILDPSGEELEICCGQSAFIPGGEKHQFKNPYSEPFEFLCVILHQE